MKKQISSSVADGATNSSDKFTPGPWAYKPWPIDLIEGANGNVVCENLSYGKRGMSETQHANARLIAACPTMYEFIYRVANGLLTVGIKSEAQAILETLA